MGFVSAGDPPDTIALNLRRVRERIDLACERAGRPPEAVTLVGVTKGVSALRIRQAVQLGIRDVGENRCQEAEPKIAELKGQGIRWHFLGHVQSNKLGRIFDQFSTIQSVDCYGLLKKANGHLADKGISREVLLEVNISGERTKTGFKDEDVRAFFQSGQARHFPHLQIQGLMGIGPLTADGNAIRRSFQGLRNLFNWVRSRDEAVRVLSMGMSQDFEVAIEEGSTMIRLGTAIFGERTV